MNRWTGRVALVTGASAGIGAGICKALVKHGMAVVGSARAVEKIEALRSDEEIAKGPGELHAIQCDLAQENQILAMFEAIRQKYGRLDVCINNAAFTTHSPLISGKTEEWSNMLKVNILGLCICTRESLILMKEKNIEDGQIIHMGSIVGHRIPVVPKDAQAPCFGIYNGTKFMIRGLAEALRQELKSTSSRIRVATISPGAVKTEFMARSLGPAISDSFFNSFECLQPNDVADAVTYILSAPPHVNVEDVIVQPLDFSI